MIIRLQQQYRDANAGFIFKSRKTHNQDSDMRRKQPLEFWGDDSQEGLLLQGAPNNEQARLSPSFFSEEIKPLKAILAEQ